MIASLLLCGQRPGCFIKCDACVASLGKTPSGMVDSDALHSESICAEALWGLWTLTVPADFLSLCRVLENSIALPLSN
jgi:hypothetical protein